MFFHLYFFLSFWLTESKNSIKEILEIYCFDLIEFFSVKYSNNDEVQLNLFSPRIFPANYQFFGCFPSFFTKSCSNMSAWINENCSFPPIFAFHVNPFRLSVNCYWRLSTRGERVWKKYSQKKNCTFLVSFLWSSITIFVILCYFQEKNIYGNFYHFLHS